MKKWISVLFIFIVGCTSDDVLDNSNDGAGNSTYNLLTNKGTSKVWNLDFVVTEEGDNFQLNRGWYEADYTYYGDGSMNITHPNYNRIRLFYMLKQDSLIIFGRTEGFFVLIRFQIESISDKYMLLKRDFFGKEIIIEHYERKRL